LLEIKRIGTEMNNAFRGVLAEKRSSKLETPKRKQQRTRLHKAEY
jgi:hypothetical protein